jgi:hypothetical protein
MTHTTQSRPDSDLGFQVKVPKSFKAFPFRSSAAQHKWHLHGVPNLTGVNLRELSIFERSDFRGYPLAGSVAVLCTRGPDVIRKEAWPFYRKISGVRLCWELEEPQGPEGFPLGGQVRYCSVNCQREVPTHSLPLSLALTLTHSHFSHLLSITLTHTQTHPLAASTARERCQLTHSHSPSLTPTLAHSHPLSLLSLTLTHSHSHTHSHTRIVNCQRDVLNHEP